MVPAGGESTLAVRLARFAVDHRDPASLPEPVRRSVQHRILDTVGIALAGSGIDTCRAVTDYACHIGGRGEARIVGVRQPVPAAMAGLVNGTLAHSLDYDDTHLPSVVHPSASVVPAALAAAEAAGAPGGAALAAIAVGIEVCVRLGMAGYDAEGRNSTYFDNGQHATSMCGTIGSAAAAALLAGGDAAGVAHAMAVAASMASGLIEANRGGGTVKQLHCGWAAHAGITAAELARRGLTGPSSVFEGRFGFFRAFLRGHYNAAAVTDGLGDDWQLPRIFFKPYPANHFTHAGIDAALALRAQGIRLDDVQALRLSVAGPTVRTIGEPLAAKRAPETGYQAKFSGPYTVVAGMLGGGGLGLGLDDFTDALARDPTRRRHMEKVTVASDETCDAAFPDEFPAILTATLRDGTVVTERALHNRGGPWRPLSDADLSRKFLDNATRRVRPETADRIAKALMSFDREPSVTPLMEMTGEP